MSHPPTEQPLIVETAAALIVGTELLSGKIREGNLHELSRVLRALGIELRRVIICPDDVRTITDDLRALLDKHDIVFTSGGLGPTHDDVTIQAVALALGIDVEHSTEMANIICNIYGERLTDNHLLMAKIPRGSRLIDTGGWPLIVADRIWLLPGIPELFRSKLSAVRTVLRGPSPIHSASLRLSVEEAHIKDALDQVVAERPDVEIGSYPKWFEPMYKTLVTIDGRIQEEVSLAHARLRHLLRDCLIDDDPLLSND